MPSNSPKWNLKYLVPGSTGNLTIMNEAISLLEQLSQLSVISRNQASQPASPNEGAAYLLTSTPTGLNWADHANELAFFYAGAWIFLEPIEGCRLWVEDEADQQLYVYDGTNWIAVGGRRSAVIRLTSPTSSANKRPIFFSPGRIIVTEVKGIVQGSGSPSVTIDARFGTSLGAAGTALTASPMTISSTTSGQSFTPTAQPVATAGEWYWVEVDSVSGTVVDCLVELIYDVV